MKNQLIAGLAIAFILYLSGVIVVEYFHTWIGLGLLFTALIILLANIQWMSNKEQ